MMDCEVSHVISPGEFYARIGTAKCFNDLEKLVTLIQNYCTTRSTHFHSPGNVQIGEILFIKSRYKEGVYARAQILSVSSEICSAFLMDYGPVEDNISSVLKIDPSVQKFADIPPCAKRYSLAFVKPTAGGWSAEANDLFRRFCVGKLIYLPTEDSTYITLIARTNNPNQVVTDLSVVLIQAGHARRVAGVEDDESIPPSIAASISDISQQLHSVGIQTDHQTITTSSTSPIPLKPPPGFGAKPLPSLISAGCCGDFVEPSRSTVSEDNGIKPKNKQSNAYIPPALREGAKNSPGTYSMFKLNHEATCTCIICTIRHTLEMPTLTHRERLENILTAKWPKLTTKEEMILRCSVTGTQLSSADRELLLDIMLGISMQKMSLNNEKEVCRKSAALDGAIQAPRMQKPRDPDLVSAASSRSHSNGEDVAISLWPTSQSTLSDSAQPDVWKTYSNHSGSPLCSTLPSAAAHKLPSKYDPYNWSDPEDDDNGTFQETSSESDPEVVLESSASTAVATDTDATSSITTARKTFRDPSVIILGNRETPTSGNNGSQYASRGVQRPNHDAPSLSRHSPNHRRESPNFNHQSFGRGQNTPNSHSPSRNSPNFGQSSQPSSRDSPLLGRSQDSPQLGRGNRRLGRGSPIGTRSVGKPKAPATTIASYGLGLSATSQTTEGPQTSVIPHTEPQPDADSMGGFGMIRYCSFCGSTQHGSASCPDGTKNLFLH